MITYSWTCQAWRAVEKIFSWRYITLRRIQNRQIACRWTRIVSLVRTKKSCALLLRNKNTRDDEKLWNCNYMSPIKSQTFNKQNGRTEWNSAENTAQKEKANKLCIREIFGLINCNNFAFFEAFLLNFFLFVWLSLSLSRKILMSLILRIARKKRQMLMLMCIREIASNMASLDTKHPPKSSFYSLREHMQRLEIFEEFRRKFIALGI